MRPRSLSACSETRSGRAIRPFASTTRPKTLPKGKGFVYADKEKSPDGIARLVLKPGAAGKGSVTLAASGSNLTTPTAMLVPPVVVQLRSKDGACFEAWYSAPKTNEPGKFDAKSDAN